MGYKMPFLALLAVAALPLSPLVARTTVIKGNVTSRTRWTRHSIGGNPRLFESKNGRLLVVETDENSASGSTLQLWDIHAGRRESTIKRSPGHKIPDSFDMMALSDDGTRLLTRRYVSNSAGILGSHLEFWTPGRVPKLRATRIEPDASMAMDAIPTANPRGWKLLTNGKIETLNASGKTVAHTALQLPPDSSSSWGALSSNASRVALSDGPTVFNATGHKILTLATQGGLNTGFEFSPAARELVVAHRTIMHSPSRVRDSFGLWDLTTPTPTQLNVSLAGPKPLWSLDGSAVLGGDGRFRVAKTGRLAAFQIAWPHAKSLRFDTAQMSRDGKTLAIADSAGNVWFGARY